MAAAHNILENVANYPVKRRFFLRHTLAFRDNTVQQEKVNSKYDFCMLPITSRAAKINAHMSHGVKNNAIFSITVNQPRISVNIW